MASNFCKKHIPRRKMKLDGVIILMVRYTIPTVNLVHAVFLLLFLVALRILLGTKGSDKHGRILIPEALIDDTEFMLITLYTANTENDQLTTPIIFAGDFNLFLDQILEAKGGNPCLKKQSLCKLLHVKEKLNLCDIWRIRNPKTKQCTFRQHSSGFIQRRLDYIFISQNFQEIAIHTKIPNAISTDYSPVLCSFQNVNQCQRGPVSQEIKTP